MMRKRQLMPSEGSGPGVPRRGNRVGSSVFAVCAGVALVCTGTTAAALAGSHAAAAAPTTECQALPQGPSTSSDPSSGSRSGANAAPSASASSASASPSGTSTQPPSENPPQICVSVSASPSTVHPGQDAVYTMNVYPANAGADKVTVALSVTSADSSPTLPEPTFSVCGSGDGTQSCSLGSLQENQTTQLEAQVAVPSSAAAGDTATLAAKVTATASSDAAGTGSVTGSATTDVVAAPSTPPPTPTPTPTPTRTHSSGHSSGSGSHHSSGSSSNGTGGSGGSSGTTADQTPLNNLPLLGSGSSGVSANGGSNSSDLFPTINPSSSSGSGRSTREKAPAHPYRATTVADVLPLNPGQLSTQIAGLIVLSLGIVLVFARISLRKPRSSESRE